jgi:hypothetical protein
MKIIYAFVSLSLTLTYCFKKRTIRISLRSVVSVWLAICISAITVSIYLFSPSIHLLLFLRCCSQRGYPVPIPMFELWNSRLRNSLQFYLKYIDMKSVKEWKVSKETLGTNEHSTAYNFNSVFKQHVNVKRQRFCFRLLKHAAGSYWELDGIRPRYNFQFSCSPMHS